MTSKEILRLNELKFKIDENQKLMKIQAINNEFKEFCLRIGGCTTLYDLNQEETNRIHEQYQKEIPFIPYSIDTDKLGNVHIFENTYLYISQKLTELLNVCNSQYYYIILGSHLPIIKCEIDKIYEHYNEINYFNSEFQSFWSEDFKQIIFIRCGRIIVGEIN